MINSISLLFARPPPILHYTRIVVPSRNCLYRRGYLPQELEPGPYPQPRRQVPSCGRQTLKDRLKGMFSFMWLLDDGVAILTSLNII